MKVGIISQARMTSTRLPGKVLLKVNDIPLLKYHADRVLQSGFPLYIATTVNATDDPIVDFCEQEGIPYFRGDEEHVLSRYYLCAKENKLDIIVRITSDCPLIDGHLIKKTLEQHLASFSVYDYISNCIERTFPRGFDFEIFSFKYIEEAYHQASLAMDIEHVTPYIHQNRNGKTQFLHVVLEASKNQYRITVDTADDFELVKQLIENYHADKMSANEIIALLDKHPKLATINAHIEQKKL